MRNIRLSLLALVFGLSACSFSFASGPDPYSAYPGTRTAMHGRGKPARRVARDAAPAIAKADRPAKPAVVEPGPEPPAKPQLVLPARVVEPKLLLHATAVEPKPKLLLAATAVESKPKLVLDATAVEPQPRLVLPARPVDPKPRKKVTRR